MSIEDDPLLRDASRPLRKCATLAEVRAAIAERVPCQIGIEAFEAFLRTVSPSVPPDAPGAGAVARPRVVIDGSPIRRRSAVVADGTLCAVRHTPLALLLLLALRPLKRWNTRSDLRIGKKCTWPTRLFEDLAPATAAGIEVVKTDGIGQFRINPELELDIAWEAFAQHDEAVIRKLALAALARGRSRR